MGRPAAPPGTLLTLRLLQTSCGLLVAASLVALSQPTPTIVAHDGAATVASAHPAVPTEWSGGGPLAIPTIGVVPPGMENWFDPTAEPTFVAPDAPPPAVLAPPSATEEPVLAADEPPAPPAELTPPPTSSAVEPTIPTTPPPEDPATDTRPTTSDPEASTAPATTTAPPTTIAPPTTTASPTTTAPPTTNDPEASTAPATSTAPPTTTAPATTPEEPAPTPPAPETNERGNVVLAFEEELTVFDDETGAVAFAIAVDSVSFDVACTDPASPPAANGSLVAVQLRVTTGPDLSAVGGGPAVRAADFHFLGPDGVTLTEAGTPSAAGCAPGIRLFPGNPVAADQELTGVVVLDVLPTPGTLVFAPDFLPVGAEWEYGPPAAG